MLPSNVLRSKIASIDQKDYGAYQALLGEYDFHDYKIIFEQIPKDPYAPPHTGIYRIIFGRDDQKIIPVRINTKIQEITSRDFLARRFFEAASKISKTGRGTGYSGTITINQPGQAILERSCVVIDTSTIELRCFIGLPAAGRKINANLAADMIFNELPEVVTNSVFKDHVVEEELCQHIHIAEEAEYLRNQLDTRGLIAFISNGSLLPRESGSSEKPLEDANAIQFKAPESLKIKLDLPNGGSVFGLGIPIGVTLIVGGGYHGKSTLLNAIEQGIYNHIPGDGREKCVSHPDSVKIRAYSGRYIEQTNISSFVNNLPFGKDTTKFSTENASGSTSQAAGIIEAIELGAKVLLMDEDTCATNFMIRDEKMQQLVSKSDEPITTFIDRVRQLYQEMGVSTILVLGGAGDYFDVADHVIQMNTYTPLDVTANAKAIAKQVTTKREYENTSETFQMSARIPIAGSIDPLNQYGKKGIYSTDTHQLNFGKYKIDLTDLEQLIELSQTKAIGFALEYAKKYMDETTTLNEIVEKVMRDIEGKGLDIISNKISPNFALFRKYEFAFMLNRLRSLKVQQREKE